MEPSTIEDCRVNEAVDPDSVIGAQARTWALAVVGEDFPPDRSARLAVWLQADPRHLRAYEQAEQALVLLDEALAGKPAAVRSAPRKSWIWAATGLAASVIAAIVLASPPAAIEAPLGQTREVSLSDGSLVVLAPGSSLRPTWRLARRSYQLQRGEAFFAVQHDVKHPFTVAAGQTKVRVLGTRFDVHLGERDRVRVSVEQGLVEVAGKTSARLPAGQTALSDGSGVHVSALASSGEVGAWRKGRLAYAGTPLEDVVADINRLGRTKIDISPTTGRLNVTAGFATDQADQFLSNLPHILPVEVVSHADGKRTIVSRSEPRATRR
jgi:transmembrane sensor